MQVILVPRQGGSQAAVRGFLIFSLVLNSLWCQIPEFQIAGMLPLF